MNKVNIRFVAVVALTVLTGGWITWRAWTTKVSWSLASFILVILAVALVRFVLQTKAGSMDKDDSG